MTTWQRRVQRDAILAIAARVANDPTIRVMREGAAVATPTVTISVSERQAVGYPAIIIEVGGFGLDADLPADRPLVECFLTDLVKAGVCRPAEDEPVLWGHQYAHDPVATLAGDVGPVVVLDGSFMVTVGRASSPLAQVRFDVRTPVKANDQHFGNHLEGSLVFRYDRWGKGPDAPLATWAAAIAAAGEFADAIRAAVPSVKRRTHARLMALQS